MQSAETDCVANKFPVLTVKALAPGSAARAGSVTLAVALEAVRVLAVAALGAEDGIAFNVKLTFESSGQQRRFQTAFFLR
jgi:hypothetical protein